MKNTVDRCPFKEECKSRNRVVCTAFELMNPSIYEEKTYCGGNFKLCPYYFSGRTYRARQNAGKRGKRIEVVSDGNAMFVGHEYRVFKYRTLRPQQKYFQEVYDENKEP